MTNTTSQPGNPFGLILPRHSLKKAVDLMSYPNPAQGHRTSCVTLGK